MRLKKIISMLLVISMLLCENIFIFQAGDLGDEEIEETSGFDENAHGAVEIDGIACEPKYKLYQDGTLYIYGSGATGNVYYSRDITNVYIEDGIDGIGDSSFFGCDKLESVKIPDSVTYIGDNAFWGCNSLESIHVPENVNTVGNGAFYRCINLKRVELPKSMTNMSDNVFEYCEKLESIKIPSGISSINSSMFSGCSNLIIVEIPSSVTSIGEFTFRGCDNLTIKCESGSAAEEYAIENDIPYELLDDITPSETPTISPSATPSETPTISPSATPSETPEPANPTQSPQNTLFSIDDITEGSVLYEGNTIDKSSYSRYKLIYCDKNGGEIKDVYSNPYSSISIEEINGISEWLVDKVSVGYGILSINGVMSNGYYASIKLMDNSPQKPTPVPTNSPTDNPTDEPIISSNPTSTPPVILPTTEPDDASNYLRGDITCDGKVDLNDAKHILKVALGIKFLTNQQHRINSDVNDDGKVDLNDAKIVLKAALGIVVLK